MSLLYRERVRLEAVTQADVEGVSGGIAVLNLRGFDSLVFVAIHHPGSNGVDVGALAERIVIADAHNIALQVNVSFGRDFAVSRLSIGVADTEHTLAAPEKCVSGQRNGVALDHGVVARSFEGLNNTTHGIECNFVEVLSAEVNLNNIEIVAAAQGDGQAVVLVIRIAVYKRRKPASTEVEAGLI